MERINYYAAIHLTQNEISFVDRENFAEIDSLKWYALYKENTKSFYAVRRDGKNKMALHNFNMNFIPSSDKGKKTIDHRNQIPLDNWKTNLRPLSKTGQNINRKKQKNNKSDTVGVSFDKKRNIFYVTSNRGHPTGTFPVGFQRNGFGIAKQKAILCRKQIEKEIPEYIEALSRPGYVPIPVDTKNYNLEDVERSNNRVLRLRGIKESNRRCLNGVGFQEDKNCFYVEWNQEGKYYSKKFKVKKNEVPPYGTTHLRAIFYLSSMESINK